MDEEVKTRFEELDKRFASTEKRFDDMKWYFGGVTTFFTLGFGVLTLILGWNYSNERTSLREDLKSFKAELGKVETPPELEIRATNRLPLANQEMPLSFNTRADGSAYMLLNHFLKNIGTSLSGPLYVKVYTSDPLRLENRSSDESTFKYEAAISPKNLDPSEIPGGYSSEWFLVINLSNGVPPPSGKYAALLKVYYGKGKVAQANFTLVVPPK